MSCASASESRVAERDGSPGSAEHQLVNDQCPSVSARMGLEVRGIKNCCVDALEGRQKNLLLTDFGDPDLQMGRCIRAPGPIAYQPGWGWRSLEVRGAI